MCFPPSSSFGTQTTGHGGFNAIPLTVFRVATHKRQLVVARPVPPVLAVVRVEATAFVGLRVRGAPVVVVERGTVGPRCVLKKYARKCATSVVRILSTDIGSGNIFGWRGEWGNDKNERICLKKRRHFQRHFQQTPCFGGFRSGILPFRVRRSIKTTTSRETSI